MLVLKALSILLLDANSVPGIIMAVGYIIGLWGIFKKSGIDSRWALVPCAREYMLAKCAGREEEGRTTSVTAFLLIVLHLIHLFLDPDGDGITATTRMETEMLLLEGLSLVVTIISLVYSIRVYSGLLEVYKMPRRWMILWILFPCVPALLLGLDKSFQPAWQVEDFRKANLQVFTGSRDVAEQEEGLTVNLTERTATEFFQKKYLLRDIHLAIRPGHMVLLLGGSGAGKTTFLNAVNGYEKAKAKVHLNGGDIYGEYKKMMYQVGFVPQQELMRGKDTVYHTLVDASLLRLPSGVSGADRRKRIDEVMTIFGLTPVKNNLVEKLSGGQKKRLSIAMEFISNPSLFILDEPDSGLDGVMARELMEQLRRIADQGKIVIVITHTPDRVIDLFDDVIVLAKDTNRTGRLAFFGSIEEARKFFGKEKMEEIVLTINRQEEGGEGRADEFIGKYAEVMQHV